ncbi:hypothetical protein BK004_01630 [bacterium CG10_46_32]|nr:MAG: hypothetical protein BK004_01630 [bacterium CG10_46_32]PIR56284.1 MAG: hypothetical protein COU73_01650 [Parcubacteria group bacterium CG10_big_fil_rev_8_21_14_0_10_46_32]
MKHFKFLILGLLFLVSGFLLGVGWSGQQIKQRALQPEGSTTLEQSVSMLIDTGSELVGLNHITFNQGDTVWSVLERAAEEYPELSVVSTDYGDLGVLIQSINNYESGKDNNYWQYWVNNEYAEVAANNHPVVAGDSIMWKFTSSLFQQL